MTRTSWCRDASAKASMMAVVDFLVPPFSVETTHSGRVCDPMAPDYRR